MSVNWKHWLYQYKNHFDIGSGEILWVTGKSVQLMGMLYVLEKLGINISGHNLIILMILAIILVPLFGLFWRKSGMWGAEQYVNTTNNPVQKELLEAARKINKSRKV